MTHRFLDQPEVLRVLFHPKGNNSFEPLDPKTRPVAVEVEPAVFLRGWLYPALPNSPAILFFHGHAEIAADYDAFADFYIQMGITFLAIDYRGYGASDGTPTASNLLCDALKIFLAADRIFHSNRLAPKELYVMGRSLGSAAAFEVAVHAADKLAGLIVESGFAETKTLLERLGMPVNELDEKRDGFANSIKISRIPIPTLIIHGKEDSLIPPAQAQELYRRSAAQKKQLVLIPRGNHNTLTIAGISKQGKSPYFEAIRGFAGG
ncbi:MAG: lysophospholipase [Oscillatoria sp. Prado101]|jgi:alpha-beta hydrolase superfamily lysophospholipase|nr:lysophospholipase [Oscillatoria sp. Prado101]